jgi:hypothetical protein
MAKVSLRRVDVVEMMNGFGAVKKDPSISGEKFTYAFIKNRKAVSASFEEMQEYQERHQEERRAFIDAISEKGEDGKPSMVKTTSAGSEEVVSPSLSAQAHKQLVDFDIAWNKTLATYGRELVDIEMHMISLADVPKKVGTSIIDSLSPMIKLSEEPVKATEEE